jgi:eukaryotic-like serine/threonine-protein kinase
VAASDEYIGRTVASKYRVEQLIGEGGMGKVYRAVQLALDKPVVLKVLRRALLSDQRTVLRFQREAKAASRLNHPNSISVLDFGRSEDGAMYIAMEYVEGRDLHSILTREWPLPEGRVIKITAQVLSALAEAHAASVIHRDLKPENIMVEQRRGEPDFVKVLDFGIAKIIDGSADEGPALTRVGFVCGTPEYMSPEQARDGRLDARSDLYAVGVILYQLMAGKLPFDSDSAVGFATKHLTEVPLPPTARRPEAQISPALEQLIMRALAKDPDQRPQTADQFRAELLALVRERPAPAGAVRRGASVSLLPPMPARATPLPGSLQAPVERQGGRGPSSGQGPRAAPGARPAPAAVTLGRLGSLGDRGASVVFKVATALLVLLALALTGTWVLQLTREATSPTAPPRAALSRPRLWEREGRGARRLPEVAARLAGEGDEAVFAGDLGLAQARFEEAWLADPIPELALKLGEVTWQQDKLEEATGWFRRYRRDAPESGAAVYLDQLPLGTRP